MSSSFSGTVMHPSSCTIAVLGAGPAGTVTALGLHRLGYQVIVLGEPRHFQAVEGVSARVVSALQQAALEHAMAGILPVSRRLAHWNGEQRAANSEYLVDRQRFDEGLWADLQAAGVRTIRARVGRVHERPDGRWCMEAREGGGEARSWTADFLVEARGRLAPHAGPAQRGPQTLSLLCQWQGQSVPADHGTAIESLPDGWAWMARLPDGRCYWQWTLDVKATPLPARAALPAWCAERRETLLARQFFGASDLDAGRQASVVARPSEPIRALVPVQTNMIRVGDAAMAVDPLSGNGIFQSLSSALQAPAVIHTMRAAPARVDLAAEFHQRRITQLFERFCRIGRDFYAMESRWPAHPFWNGRSQWPDDKPAHDVSGPGVWPDIGRGPALCGSEIIETDLVVTPEQPLGIWQLDGEPLAPIVRAVMAGQSGVLDALPEERRGNIVRWLRQHGLPVSPGDVSANR